MSKKKIITIISLFVVMVLSVSAISYSLAGLGKKDNEKNEIMQADPVSAATSTYKTSIDLIIDNSYTVETSALNIVEIVPEGGAASALADYAVNGNFKQYVIDANKNNADHDEMKADTIRYDLVSVSGLTAMSDTMASNILGGVQPISAVLNSADLIYLNCPSSSAYKDKMSDEIFDFLRVYATGKAKPLIIDYTTSTGSTSLDDKTYGDLFDVIKANKIRYNTYPWPTGYTAAQFFAGSDFGKGQSLYNKFRGNPTGKVLVVTTDTGLTRDDTIAYQLQNNYVPQSVYFTEDVPPEELEITTISPAALTEAALDGDYDFIVFESNISSVKPGAILYTKIKGLSEQYRYLFIGVSNANITSFGSGSGGSGTYDSTDNYKKLISLFLTANGISKQKNILSVSNGYFTSLNTATGNSAVEAAKPVADLLNASDYRGSKTSGEGGRKYRVLEIEPCYPIDLELAAKQEGNSSKLVNGCYYTEADSVLENVTKDEIEPGTEYFAFHMSKAKISHATGIPFDEIEVDQMSANELISTKDVLNETYDMIYIGGDFSAYTPYTLANYGQDGGNWTGQYNPQCYKGFTAFDMYTHTGLLSKPEAARPFGEVVQGQTSFAFSGHDISAIKLEELMNYVDAGLPIIIDAKVAEAFDESYAKDNRLEQLALKSIDPDCNMYKFLKYAKEKIANDAIFNVSWGEVSAQGDDHTVVVSNGDGAYGNTLIYDADGNIGVTVFDETREAVIKNLYDGTKKRPQLVITEKPVEYDENDRSTVNSYTNFSISAKVVDATPSTKGYAFYLMIDEDGNGVFDDNDGIADAETECKDSAKGMDATLSYELEDDFFGLIYWKVLVYSLDNGALCDAKKGSAFFKIDPEAKKTVRVLQIMPLEKGDQGEFSDGHSLYFCTECQQSMQIIENNVTMDAANKGVGNEPGGNPGLNSHYNTDGKTKDGIYVGKHEHNFGIVKYSTYVENDDWEDNFADILTHGEDGTLETGDFEFDLDIVTVNQFDELCQQASTRTEDQAKSNKSVADEKYDEYQDLLNSPELQTARENLEAELYKAAQIVSDARVTGKNKTPVILKGIGTADNPGLWMTDHQYYKFWEYCNSGADDGLYNAVSAQLGPLKTAYATYIALYDAVLDLKSEYKSYARASGTADTWILDNYDVIVLGFADNFNGRDLKQISCDQIKTYVENDGYVFNTHDTMTKYANSGAVKLTQTLLESFGMDRFHANGVSDGSAPEPEEDGIKAKLTVGGYSETTGVTVSYPNGGDTNFLQGCSGFSYSNRDVYFVFKATGDWRNYAYDHIDEGDVRTDGKITVHFVDENGNTVLADKTFEFASDNWSQRVQVKDGSTFDQRVESVTYPETTGKITLDGSNTTANAVKTATKVNITDIVKDEIDEEAEDFTVTFMVYGTDGTTVLGADIPVSLTIGSTTYEELINRTTMERSFTIPMSIFDDAGDIVPDIADFTDAIGIAKNSSTKYVKYSTSRDYAFFSERLVAESPADYAACISANGLSSWVKYNSPIGVADAFAMGDSSSNNTSPYLYVKSAAEAFDHANLETDGFNFEAKYGTRRASKINQGCITVYPFAISDELLISGTHGQWFQLDIEDKDVQAWYALGGNFVAEGVTAYFTRYDSAIYAASPRDGLNNYFLYNKSNVFYSGAGHLVVTGRKKDNNDERKLFINVIVNCVNKGKSAPKLKLYNVCPNVGDTNCEDQYVNPKDANQNKELAKHVNTLYYNEGAKIYQYNIEDTADDVYPTFDFKAIAGSAPIKKIEVFYDLNYGDGTGMDKSDDFSDDANHKMILKYNGAAATAQTGIRQKLRQSTAMPNLKLLPQYMANYNNYTYIVIHVKDANNKVTNARVKINVIPYLFDLTDATFDYQRTVITTSSTVLDITDKSKFNI